MFHLDKGKPQGPPAAGPAAFSTPRTYPSHPALLWHLSVAQWALALSLPIPSFSFPLLILFHKKKKKSSYWNLHTSQEIYLNQSQVAALLCLRPSLAPFSLTNKGTHWATGSAPTPSCDLSDFIIFLSSSLISFWPHWPYGPCRFLSQGLCTCCSLSLEYLSLGPSGLCPHAPLH